MFKVRRFPVILLTMLLPTLSQMSSSSHAEPIIGADLSYLPKVEQNGGLFRMDGQTEDALEIFRTGVIRLYVYVSGTTPPNPGTGLIPRWSWLYVPLRRVTTSCLIFTFQTVGRIPASRQNRMHGRNWISIFSVIHSTGIPTMSFPVFGK